MPRVASLPASARVALLLFMAIGIAVIVKVTPVGHWLETEARGAVARAGVWAILVFPIGFAAVVALGVPTAIPVVVGGIAFGLWPGLPLNLAGAALGAGGGFYVGRWLGREAVEQKFGKWLGRIELLERPWVTFVTFLTIRMNPFLPGSAFALGGGVTKAPFVPYLVGSSIGVAPAVATWTWYAGEVGAGRASAASSARLAVCLGAIAVVSLLPGVVALWRRRPGRPGSPSE